MTDGERKLRASIAAHESWSRTDDRTARTNAARTAYRESFEQVVDPEGKLDQDERTRRAEHAYKAQMKRIALKSATARRLKAEARREAA